MKKSKKYIRVLNAIGILCTIAAVIWAVYIMAHGLGLADSLDFGAGAYYYADMPGFAELVNGKHYTSPVSMGTLTILFLAWGFLMYRLWIWLDRRFK